MNWKQLAATLMLSSVLVLAGGSATQAYPPGSGIVTASPSSPASGASFTATATNCQPGETVNFAFQGQAKSATCSASKTAAASLTAPTTAGTFTGTASYATSGGTLSFTVNVAATGGLPATGSSGSNSTMMIAAVLVASGIGMFLVAQRRRKLSLGAPA